MNKIRCLLVDDEPLAIKLLANHIAQLDSFEVVGTCPNAVKAMEVLRSTPVDLLFLDIQMPQLTGIDFLKGLKDRPAVIITTAYREYALEGYDLDLVDYLLKPITFERFFKAADRYLRSRKQEPDKPPEKQNMLHLRSGTKTYPIELSAITYAESMDDKVTIHYTGGKLTIPYKIGALEDKLPRDGFLRIHRSFIVNLKAITSYSATAVEVTGKILPIGTRYKEGVLQVLKKV